MIRKQPTFIDIEKSEVHLVQVPSGFNIYSFFVLLFKATYMLKFLIFIVRLSTKDRFGTSFFTNMASNMEVIELIMIEGAGWPALKLLEDLLKSVNTSVNPDVISLLSDEHQRNLIIAVQLQLVSRNLDIHCKHTSSGLYPLHSYSS
jgi:hypothetical protein